MWMILRKVPTWSDVEISFDYVEKRYGDKIHSIISRDSLHDEVRLMQTFIESNLNQWFTDKLSSDKIWTQVFQNFRQSGTQLVNLEKLVEFAFALAGTSTEVERVFSLIKQIWSDQRSRLDLKTVDALLSIQFNSEMTCREFYETIKKDSIFLDKAHSNNKYDN